MVGAVVAEEIAGGEAVGVNATCTSTRGIPARRDTIRTQEMVRMVEEGIMAEGDITNRQATTPPRLKPIATRTEGTLRKAITRIINRVGIEAHNNRRMIRGLRINSPTEVAEGDIIPGITKIHILGRMGMAEGEEANLLIEGEVHTVAAGMKTKEVKEGGIGMVAAAVGDTINHRKAVATIGVVIVVGVITLINPAEVTSPVEAIIQAEATSLAGVTNPVEDTNLAEVINPADHTTLVLSLTGTEEGIAREVVVVGEGTDHTNSQTNTLHRFPSSMFSSCFGFGLTFPLIGDMSYPRS